MLKFSEICRNQIDEFDICRTPTILVTAASLGEPVSVPKYSKAVLRCFTCPASPTLDPSGAPFTSYYGPEPQTVVRGVYEHINSLRLFVLTAQTVR